MKSVKYALQHNLGLGGACVMVVYEKYQPGEGRVRDDQSSDPAVLEKFEQARL